MLRDELYQRTPDVRGTSISGVVVTSLRFSAPGFADKPAPVSGAPFSRRVSSPCFLECKEKASVFSFFVLHGGLPQRPRSWFSPEPFLYINEMVVRQTGPTDLSPDPSVASVHGK